MTGWADKGEEPLSRVTVGTLEDFGYTVDYSQADNYSLPKNNVAAQSTGVPINDVLIFPESSRR